jgi:hypothetical protein
MNFSKCSIIIKNSSATGTVTFTITPTFTVTYTPVPGSTWTEVTAAADSSKRHAQVSLVYGGKMWVIGGWNGSSYLNDVYRAN